MSLTKPVSTPSIAYRPLLAIAAAVALAHAALLHTLPGALPVAAPTVVQALNTRSIAAPPVPEAVPAPVPRLRKKRPAPPADAAPALPPPAAADPSPEPSPAPAPEPVPEPPVAAASAPEPVAPEPVAVASAPAPAASAPAVPLTAATVFVFPDPVRLLYELSGESKKMTYHARGDLLWQHDGQHYDATLSASLLFLGSRTRTSSGQITPQGLAPTRFADKWRGEKAAHFDQANHRATFSANTPDVALLGAAQDQLSVILQIAGILAAEPAKYPPGASLALQTIGPTSADIWQFTVEGPETIRLPSGTLDSLKLTRNPRKEYDQKVEVWLAPAMGYLPVRLKITNASGDFVDQQLRGVEKP